MVKACDRVSWFFPMKVLRRMGFSNQFIDIIWRLLSNNYYSLLINGKSYGFFTLPGEWSRETPSPQLFSFYPQRFWKKQSTNLNHPSYANDTIIFASSHADSLEKIMNTLQEYGKESGQIVNKEKSFFYLLHNVAAGTSQQVE